MRLITKKERRKFSASFKAKVAIEAIKEASTVQEIASKYQLHPTQIAAWKREFLENAELVFSKELPAAKEEDNPKEKELYSKIGELQVQPGRRSGGFPKKSLGEMTLMQKRELISPEYPDLSVSAQCKLIGLQRSSYYFKPKGESLLNQQLMKAIDRKFLECPFYGVERMTDHLRGLRYRVGVKRVRRLYKLMNLRTLYPKPNLSKVKASDHKYPYLLKGLKIERPNQVWQADITYIPMFRGFMYMFAIIDVYSRRIVGWSVSNTMSMDRTADAVV